MVFEENCGISYENVNKNRPKIFGEFYEGCSEKSESEIVYAINLFIIDL